MPHQQAAERLPGRVVFGEHRFPGCEVDARTDPVRAHVEDTGPAVDDELAHRLDQRVCIAAVGGHLMASLNYLGRRAARGDFVIRKSAGRH